MKGILPILLFVLIPSADAAEPAVPKVLDERLVIELFAAAPQIVTPTGIAVDRQGRVLVVESHTHFRPKDYKGPPADRIRIFEDTDGDGRADRIGTFHEGTRFTMNLAAGHDGAVFVATRNLLFRLQDTDGDGRADRRMTLVRLDTPGNYPHNGLSGFALDVAGNLYFGLGENLGADYKLIGRDGTTLSGGGEGGNIYRCRTDGSKLQRLATGFWNPFHLCRDTYGRLFAVDNDPDWRPPCRLLHIVPGGDYGYRFRNGRKGLHPFTSWFGEVPGTLGIVAGTGEAPSGVIAYESDHLPADYRGDLLATSWGFHAIQRYRLRPRGATFQSAAETIVKGDEFFRPVGIALAPDGSLYVSDWGHRSYDLHYGGRIWRIAANKPAKRDRPADPATALASPHRPLRESAARKLVAQGEAGLAVLREKLRRHDDPRVRAVALEALAAAGDDDRRSLAAALADPSADVRALAVELSPLELVDLPKMAADAKSPLVRAAALRRMNATSDGGVKALLRHAGDDDPFVRQAARLALGRSLDDARLLQLRLPDDPIERLQVALLLRGRVGADAAARLSALLRDGDPQVRFVAVQWVGEAGLVQFKDELMAGLTRGEASGPLLDAYLAALDLLENHQAAEFETRVDQIVARLITSDQSTPAVRAQCLRRLPPDHAVLTAGRLAKMSAGENAALRLEAVRTLRESPHGERHKLLAEIAGQRRNPVSLRAAAIVGLSPDDADSRKLLLALASDRQPVIRQEARRSLRGAEFTVDAKRPPADQLDAWQRRLAGPADAAAGERVFFHPRGPRCYACHRVHGRGGDAGPDLSSASRLTRERIVESILQPSREIAPRFVSWSILKTDGQSLTGVLVTEKGEQQVYADPQGKLIHLDRSAIEDRRPLATSIMPDALAGRLTDQEFRDLLAYLMTLGAAEAAP